MENQLQKTYGLFTAITMVVGIVIGSGIFFKTEAILEATGGSAMIGILSLLIIGAVMLICSYTFSILATRYEKVNGVIDYAEALVGERYAYYVGYFMAVVYYPTLTCVLAWVSARYTCELFSLPDPAAGGACFAIAGFYLTGAFALNSLAPIAAGKLQVSTTVAKLVPLLLVGVIGVASGLRDGTLASNFAAPAASGNESQLLFSACVSMAFSFEGWIITTTINSELKNARRNLPIALMAGAAIVVAVYVCYYLGMTGSLPAGELMSGGSAMAFERLFGRAGATALRVLIVVSCLGTCNGLMLGCVRGIYSVAARGRGFAPRVFARVDKETNMPANSCIMALLICSAWLLYFYLGTLTGRLGPLRFDPSELTIVTLYGAYIPMFIMMMRRGGLGVFKGRVMPLLSIGCCAFMLAAAFIGSFTDVCWYLAVFAVIMLTAVFFDRR